MSRAGDAGMPNGDRCKGYTYTDFVINDQISSNDVHLSTLYLVPWDKSYSQSACISHVGGLLWKPLSVGLVNGVYLTGFT